MLFYNIVDPVGCVVLPMNEFVCMKDENASIVLDIPCFNIYVTCDLAFQMMRQEIPTSKYTGATSSC